MLQEIITYLIVAGAIGLASYKIVKRFRKKRVRKINFKKETFTMEHNCSDCSASGCALRDLPKKATKNLKECDTNYHSK